MIKSNTMSICNRCSTATAALSAVACLLFIPRSGIAHEFWIEPLAYSRDVSKTIFANFRNGENFSGASIPFITDRVKSAIIYTAKKAIPVQSRLGDLPAIHYDATTLGWHLFAMQTNPQTVRYTEPDKFEKFLHAHDLQALTDQHLHLRKAVVVTELYTRYSKSLVQVISETGEENNLTTHLANPVLKFEWVLNSSSDFNKKSVSLKLLYEGKPVAGRQAEVYFKNGPATAMSIYKTDEGGNIIIQTPDPGAYLVNAVKARVLNEHVALISTDWASLTFEVPSK